MKILKNTIKKLIGYGIYDEKLTLTPFSIFTE